MKQWLINMLMSKVIRVVRPNDVLRDIKGKIYLGNHLISPEELKSIQSEIKALESMRIWSILNETVKELSLEKGWKTSLNMEHLNTAKTMYYVTELQSSLIRVLKNKK